MINPKKPKSQFMTEQEIHLEKQKELIREKKKIKEIMLEINLFQNHK